MEFQLTEEDIPGASLGERPPEALKIAALKLPRSQWAGKAKN